MVSEEKLFENVDGRWMDDRWTKDALLDFKLTYEPICFGELKKLLIIPVSSVKQK